MTNQYDNITDEMLIEEIMGFEAEKAEADAKSKRIKNILLERKKSEISAALKAKTEPFGAVSQYVGGMKVTFTTPKKVEWDQKGLEELWAQMLADGANPNEYLKIEYKVSEDAYKAWPSNLKEYFEPHRMVTPGNIAIKIEPVKEK